VTRAAVIVTILASTLVANAQTVAEKKQRAKIDDAMSKASDDIKDCGKKIAVKFDWKKIGRDKNEYYSNELNSVGDIGIGINKLCGDKDYKEALAKISTIIYRSTNDDKIRVKATVSGGTLTLENYTFGSTRHTDDYVAAGKAAL
jgi:hypothetical protein